MRESEPARTWLTQSLVRERFAVPARVGMLRHPQSFDTANRVWVSLDQFSSNAAAGKCVPIRVQVGLIKPLAAFPELQDRVP
jgi:hypothetical protein